MPDIEAIIEAILRGQFKDAYDTMPKLELWQAKQNILELLIPGIPPSKRSRPERGMRV